MSGPARRPTLLWSGLTVAALSVLAAGSAVPSPTVPSPSMSRQGASSRPAAAPAPGSVLATRTVTRDARTPGGEVAGQVSVTVQLIRDGAEVQARATFHSTLPGPAVATGTLRLLDGNGSEVARSNPRQTATLDPGTTPVLVTPRSPLADHAGAACVDATLNVWSGPQAPGADARVRSGPALDPTVFTMQVCRA
ncbi:hypothetical protein [Deinococcus soli (ex Cha et al. 2016)]|uniref:Uncharacterized protein n=2 Tax=Deinococcus soli (ex Cha et al. 2016) TaxID=1309411 RepID=A0AAE3XA65_9DEIO|nr:hypothetical protein [Deinococcus soli (ex Cha et al. 2016)]MDR6217451.1 hypothetical protein [Deinococcus soli (ex Cha et al. 2016)]MDR6326760.1 hypothetical protein [Deinococcus soli (ex Cha et al. 2016)]MDR6750513.1 hypothetical protein [Deinococcus soli (ex Cha et al. 2016)]